MFKVSRSYHSMARQIFKFSCVLPSSMTFLARATPLQDHAQSAYKFQLNSEIFQFQSNSESLLLSTNFSSFSSNKYFSKNLLPRLQKKNLQCFLGSAPLRSSPDLWKIFFGLRSVVGGKALCFTFVPNTDISTRTLGCVSFQVDFLDGKKSRRELYHKSLPISKQLNKTPDKSFPLDPSTITTEAEQSNRGAVTTEAEQPHHDEEEALAQRGLLYREQYEKLLDFKNAQDPSLKSADDLLEKQIKVLDRIDNFLKISPVVQAGDAEVEEEKNWDLTWKLLEEASLGEDIFTLERSSYEEMTKLHRRSETFEKKLSNVWKRLNVKKEKQLKRWETLKDVIEKTVEQIEIFKNSLSSNPKKGFKNSFRSIFNAFKLYFRDSTLTQFDQIKNYLEALKDRIETAAKNLDDKKNPHACLEQTIALEKFVYLLRDGEKNFFRKYYELRGLYLYKVGDGLENSMTNVEKDHELRQKILDEPLTGLPERSESAGIQGSEALLERGRSHIRQRSGMHVRQRSGTHMRQRSLGPI